MTIRSALGRRRPGRGERGSMSVEVVLLAPILVILMLLVVAGGRLVQTKSDIDAAARDGARAASYERDAASAQAAAQAVVNEANASDCGPVHVSGFGAGDTVSVRISCRVSLSSLGLVGLPGSTTIDAESSAPVDYYRRTG